MSANDRGKHMEGRVLLSVLEGGTLGKQDDVSCELSSAIWRRMPDEVLERILLMLPTVAKFRFRAVAREWNVRLSCPKFLELGASYYSGQPSTNTSMLCALDICEKGNLLDERDCVLRRNCGLFRSCKVVELDMSFIPPRWRLPEFNVFEDEGGLLCVKSGLACLGDFRNSKEEVRLCVLNPVTRIAKELPLLRPQEVCVAGKTRLSGSWEMSLQVYGDGRFEVTLLTGIEKLDGKNSLTCGTVWGFFVYSSADNAWKLTEGHHVDRLWEDESRSNVLHAVCDGILYTLSDDDGDFIMHDLATGAFKFAGAENLPESASITVSLLEFQGELYYVLAGLASEEAGLFEIWRFNRFELVWEQFAVLPRMLQRELFSSTDSSMDRLHIEIGSVDGVGDSICIRIDICNGQDWRTTESQHLVACVVSTKSWQIILRDVCPGFFERFILFQPRLSYFP